MLVDLRAVMWLTHGDSCTQCGEIWGSGEDCEVEDDLT